MKLAANINDLFGKITPPPGPTELYKDPVVGLQRSIIVGIQLVLIIGAIFCLLYLLWGAIDWIAAGDDKEALEKAHKRLKNAFVGIIMLVVSLSIFTLVAGNLLNIIQFEDGGFIFNIPRF